MVHVEPTDAQLPGVVRTQATGIAALAEAIGAFLASVVPLGRVPLARAWGPHRVPRERLDALLRVADGGAYARAAETAAPPDGAGLTAGQLRRLWRAQEGRYATLRDQAQRLRLHCRPDPAAPASCLIGARQLLALRAALRAARASGAGNRS